MEKEFRLEKALIEERRLPISGYNYSPIKERYIFILPSKIIARVTSHIPDKGQVTIRYSGIYANVHRGKIKKASLAASSIRIVEDKLRRIHSRG